MTLKPTRLADLLERIALVETLEELATISLPKLKDVKKLAKHHHRRGQFARSELEHYLKTLGTVKPCPA